MVARLYPRKNIGTRVKGASKAIGIGFGGSRWDPSKLGDAFWLDPVGRADLVTYAAQPTWPDGDMEAAGTASWQDLYNAPDLLTKEPGSATGSGSQVLRLGVSPATIVDAAQLGTGAAIGNRERHTFWSRADASYNAAIADQGANSVAFAVSPAWAQFVAEFTPTTGWRDIQKGSTRSANWLDVDNWSIANLSVASIEPRTGMLNRCNDGRMEYAGTSQWGVWGSATLTKEADPYEGTQCLRIAYNGVIDPGATKGGFTSGHTYRVAGVARSDGTQVPYIYHGGSSTTIWTGTNSTDWQPFDVTFVSTGAASEIRFYSGSSAGYVEFDAIEVYDLDAPAGTVGQATATKQGWIDPDTGWVRFDGTADLEYSSLPLGAFDFLHDGREWSFGAAVLIPDLSSAATHQVFGNIYIVGSNFGASLLVRSTGQISMYIGNGTASPAVNNAASATGVIASGVPAIITGSYDTTTGHVHVWVDGVLVIDQAPTASMVAGLPQYAMSFGGSLGAGYYMAGMHADVILRPSALTDTERTNLERFLSNKHRIPLASDPLSDAELEGWTGLVTWVDPSYSGTYTYAAQPTLADADMEAAGTSSWAYMADRCALSKETADPPETGSRYLKILTTGLLDFSWAYQNVCTVGARYSISGWARSTNQSGNIYIGSSFSEQVATNGAPWTAFSKEGTTSDSYAYFGSSSNALGSISEWDNITMTSPSLAAVTPRAGSVTDDFANATATAMPWEDSTTGAIRYVNDYVDSGAAAASWKCLHDNTAASGFFVFTPDASGDGTWRGLVATGGSASADAHFVLRLADNNRAVVLVGSGVSWVVLDQGSAAGSVLGGSTYLVEWHKDASGTYQVWLNGTSVASSSATFSASNPPVTLRLGDQSPAAYPFVGQQWDTLVLSRQLSLTEKTRLRTKLANKHGITLP